MARSETVREERASKDDDIIGIIGQDHRVIIR